MEDTLKERFEQHANNLVPAFMIPVVVSAMQTAYNLALSERWVDVRDRLPDNGRDVLVADEESDIVCIAWYSSFEECFNRQVAAMNITHWTEIPTPPQTKD